MLALRPSTRPFSAPLIALSSSALGITIRTFCLLLSLPENVQSPAPAAGVAASASGRCVASRLVARRGPAGGRAGARGVAALSARLAPGLTPFLWTQAL